MQKFLTSFVIPQDGRYALVATRTDETDPGLLSIYINRVKKVWEAPGGQDFIAGTFPLEKNDQIDSTGTLNVTPSK